MNIGVWKAILFGWMVVNVPATLIIVCFIIVGIKVFPSVWWLMFILGLVFGWSWWSFFVPRWRRWARHRGVDPDQLQEAAVATGLVWPKGSFLEKTEMKIKQ